MGQAGADFSVFAAVPQACMIKSLTVSEVKFILTTVTRSKVL